MSITRKYLLATAAGALALPFLAVGASAQTEISAAELNAQQLDQFLASADASYEAEGDADLDAAITEENSDESFIEESADAVGDAAEDAAEWTEGAVEDAGEWTEDAAEDVGEALDDAFSDENAEDEVRDLTDPTVAAPDEPADAIGNPVDDPLDQ